MYFQNSTFLPNKTIHVYASVNYFNATGSFIHAATVSWTETVTTKAFNACVLKAGRNDRIPPDGGLTYIDYVAFQGNPVGAVAGQEMLSDWWDGTTCKLVEMPKVKCGDLEVFNFKGIMESNDQECSL